jgi:hypothetical protein
MIAMLFQATRRRDKASNRVAEGDFRFQSFSSGSKSGFASKLDQQKLGGHRLVIVASLEAVKEVSH